MLINIKQFNIKFRFEIHIGFLDRLHSIFCCQKTLKDLQKCELFYFQIELISQKVMKNVL